MARTRYDPDSIDEELAVIEERDAEEATMPYVSLDAPISDLVLTPARSLDMRASAGDAIRAMQREQVTCITVTDCGSLAGIFTRHDVVSRMLEGVREPDETLLAEVMTPAPETLQIDDPLVFLLSRMHLGGYHHVPIVDDRHRPLFVARMRDVVSHLLRRLERRLSTLPPSPFRGERRVDVEYG